MLLAVVGLSTVLARNPDALTLIRVLGGLYLVWLGASTGWKARYIDNLHRRSERGNSALREGSERGAFTEGFLTNVTNPKAMLFFASVLPQFISPGASVAGQILLLGVVDVLFGFLPWTVVVAFGDRLGQRMSSTRFHAWRDRASGTALAGVGGAILATTR
jgi:threonine/homoserine/homoserine lactone efflux protein